MFIEYEGALFQGGSRLGPTQVWKPKKGAWVAFEGEIPNSAEWGREVTESEALAIIEAAGEPPRTVGEDMEIDPWKYDDYDGGREEPKPGPMAHLDLRAKKRAAANVKPVAEPGKDYGTA